jgi:hypothetical protein
MSLDPDDNRGYVVQIDVFAIVLDFWNVEHEHYDDNLGTISRRTQGICVCLSHTADTTVLLNAVKMKICRESYSDYEAAASLINREYDAVLLNLKLGELLLKVTI